MDFNKPGVAETTVTRDLAKLSQPTGNVYETVMIIARRSNQIAVEMKKELNSKLEEFSHYTDTLEETFENREQIEISRHYERLPKPASIAIKEFEDNEIFYKLNKDTEDQTKIGEDC